ncbi:MAG: contact-dependent growth inhibition system immunity protein [Chloroflexota bacterium]|nr:contact-dependent growth inhibition system immunity protein [Chloroflexota bacterium]
MESERDGLFTLMAGYFHQDWDLDDPTWEAVVERYLRDANPSQIVALHRELGRVLERSKEEHLERLLFQDWGCQFDPRPEYSLREWLVAISELVDRYSASRGLLR